MVITLTFDFGEFIATSWSLGVDDEEMVDLMMNMVPAERIVYLKAVTENAAAMLRLSPVQGCC